LRERRQRLKESRYSGDDISNITYSIELYNRYTTVLWLYILHIVFIVVLLILLREKIDKTIESYVGIFLQRSNEFTS